MSRLRLGAAAALVVAAGGLSGCAAIGDSAMSQAFVDPAKYSLFNCEQLGTERKELDKRLDVLTGLMRKAETGVGGAVVSEVAYRNDYINLKAQSRLAEQTWRDNKCVEAPAAAPAPAGFGPAPRAPAHPGRGAR
ncbi:twin-arginine translocation pathway signal [Rhodopseudomonas palustris]|uniref:twin-arginine translocation pathway signal n=1 Tax=Rhodopseudomonas palustris TaxID=1076 RepID=UPI0002DEB3CF